MVLREQRALCILVLNLMVCVVGNTNNDSPVGGERFTIVWFASTSDLGSVQVYIPTVCKILEGCGNVRYSS